MSGRSRRQTQQAGARGPSRRWLVAAIAAVALLGTSLTALAPAGATVFAKATAKKVTITYWQGWVDPVSKAGVTKAIKLFEKANPNINVKEVDLPNDQKLITAVAGGKPPDAATLFSVGDLGPLAQKGALYNLGTLAKQAHLPLDLKNYDRASLHFQTYQGKTYGLALESDPYALFINTDIWKAAGLTAADYPKTMSQLATDAVKLTKESGGRVTQMGLVPPYDGGTLGPFLPFFFNDSLVTKSGKPKVNGEGAIDALSWEKGIMQQVGVQAYDNYNNSKSQNPLGNKFLDQHSAMTLDGDWVCNFAPKYAPTMHWTVVPMPYPDGHPQWADSSYQDGAIDVVPKGAQHPQQALKFIEFMNSPKAQVALETGVGGQAPTITSSKALLDTRAGNPCWKLMSQLASGSRAFSWPVTPVTNAMETGLSTAEDSVMRGKQSPKQALDALQQTLNSQLQQAAG